MLRLVFENYHNEQSHLLDPYGAALTAPVLRSPTGTTGCPGKNGAKCNFLKQKSPKNIHLTTNNHER